jgi:hypothetical protein
MSDIAGQLKKCRPPETLGVTWGFSSRLYAAEKDIEDLCKGDDGLECWMLRQLIDGLGHVYGDIIMGCHYAPYVAAIVYIARQKWGDKVAKSLVNEFCD